MTLWVGQAVTWYKWWLFWMRWAVSFSFFTPSLLDIYQVRLDYEYMDEVWLSYFFPTSLYFLVVSFISSPLPLPGPPHLCWTLCSRVWDIHCMWCLNRAVATGRTTKSSRSGNLSEGTTTPKNEHFLINMKQHFCVSTTSTQFINGDALKCQRFYCVTFWIVWLIIYGILMTSDNIQASVASLCSFYSPFIGVPLGRKGLKWKWNISS